MNCENVLVWNVRGLSARAHRNVVHEVVSLERVSMLCLQETKLPCFTRAVINEMLGPGFDYCFLPTVGASGGVLVAWRTSLWSLTQRRIDTFSVSTLVSMSQAPNSQPFWLTTVYGPQTDADKEAFLQELRNVRATCPGPWLVCGDFNLIYQAADKNNGRLNRRSMRAFQRCLNDLHLSEVFLHGRRFTWSSERERPTLERIDRVFVSSDWLELFPDHRLRALSTDCSDHAPLLLQTCTIPWAKRRFRFETIWVKFDGYLQVVSEAWDAELADADPCRTLDHKLRQTAKALKSWSMKKVGSIRLQLSIARKVITGLEHAQDRRGLSPEERALRTRLKWRCLGLASMSRTITRQRSRLLFLEHGDANTKLFHLQACHRSRKNTIHSLAVDDLTLVDNDQMADALHDHFQDLLGTPTPRSLVARFD